MIIYFADRRMNILGIASTGLPEGIFIKDDEKTEEIEVGVATLEFDLYYTDDTREDAEKWADVGNYILRKNGDEQEFYTIIESETSVYDKRINIYAEDAGMDLLNETVGAYTADKAYPVKHYIEKFSYDSGFELGLNEISDLSRKLSWDGETTASARLLSVATQFDAELSYTFEIDELKIKHKYINLHKKRGKDNGVELRINREVSNIIEKKSVADLATGLSVQGGTPEGSEQPITLNGYKYDDGDIYISGTCVFSRTALTKWSRYLSESGNDVGHIMQTYTYDTTSQQELCNHAVSKLKKICDASVTYEVELAYLPAGVKIGDMVNIIDDAGKLYLSARIMKLVASETHKTYTATLGDYTLKSDGISEKVLELAEQFEKIAKNRTLYTWVVFADDEKGSNISVDASEKAYMGIAYNRLTKNAELSNPEIFTWVKITGEQGIPGPAGKDGSNGTDGRTSFFHVKFSDVAEPTSSQMNDVGGKYIGTYVDFEVRDSSDPKKYTWRQFEGDTGKQGEKGIPGTNGENGLTSYLHIAYATSADGKTGFSTNEPEGKTYIGQYTDFEEDDSTDPGKYGWSKIKGEKGDIGPQGEKGEKGDKGDSGIIVSSIAPSSPTVGQLWQTASGQPIKRWNGSSWVLHYISVDNLDVATLSAITANIGTLTGNFESTLQLPSGGVDNVKGTTKIYEGLISGNYALTNVSNSIGSFESGFSGIKGNAARLGMGNYSYEYGYNGIHVTNGAKSADLPVDKLRKLDLFADAPYEWKLLKEVSNKDFGSVTIADGYHEFLLTVGPFKSGDTGLNNRVLASVIIPRIALVNTQGRSDANGMYQAFYNSSYWAGLNYTAANTIQIRASQAGAIARLWAR